VGVISDHRQLSKPLMLVRARPTAIRAVSHLFLEARDLDAGLALVGAMQAVRSDRDGCAVSGLVSNLTVSKLVWPSWVHDDREDTDDTDTRGYR
jgi:hypothetical protein